MTAAKKAPAKRAKTKPAPPVGADRIPTPSQGYYRDPDTGEKLRRVTTILEQGAPKGGLLYWAAGVVAQEAVMELPWLVKHSRRPDDRAEAIRWLAAAHTRKKEEKGKVGSAVHTLVECHILNKPVPLDISTDDELKPYMENFHRFVEDWDVEFTASEMVVAHPPDDTLEFGYAGTLDYTLRSVKLMTAIAAMRDEGGNLLYPTLDPEADLDTMGDTKTGGGLDEKTYQGNPKGVYPEAGLQMAAYRKAPVCWLSDGTKVAMPPTHEVGIVLHLRPEGYRIYPMRCDDWVFEKFTHIIHVAEWTQLSSSTKQTIRGNPLTNPTGGADDA